MKERSRLRSIPPRTLLDVLRKQKNVPPEFSKRSIQKQEPAPDEFDINRHIFKKPTREKSNKPLVVAEAEKIRWEMEVHEDYDTQGNLGIILQFFGISLTNTPVFEKSRVDYGQNSSVFYSRIGYKNRLAFLILATYGDIFESQVVANKIDVKPFFREETYLPRLTVTHDPTSMAVYEKNRLVVVHYERFTTPGVE